MFYVKVSLITFLSFSSKNFFEFISDDLLPEIKKNSFSHTRLDDSQLSWLIQIVQTSAFALSLFNPTEKYSMISIFYLYFLRFSLSFTKIDREFE